MTTQYKFEIILSTSDDPLAGEFDEYAFRKFISDRICVGIDDDYIEGIGAFSITQTSKIEE